MFYPRDMKTLFLLSLVVIFNCRAQAQILEAKPIASAVEAVFSREFRFKEVGRMFGYYSTQSCVYVSSDMIVIKNYCSPKKSYPAKSFRIVSPKFGMIDFYQEEVTQDILKREVRISTFPVPLSDVLKSDLTTYDIAELNLLFEKLHNKNGAACWSTNFSFYTEDAEAKCNRSQVDDVDQWFKETQKLTSSEKAWAEMIFRLEEKFKN